MKETANPKEKTDYKNLEEEPVEEKPDLNKIFKSLKNLEIQFQQFNEKFTQIYEKVNKEHNDYEEILEHDTYLYSTFVLAIFSPFLLSPLFFPFYTYFEDKKIILKNLFISGFMSLIFCPLFFILMIPLMIPGFFTPLVQIFAIEQILSSIDSSEMNTELFDLKCLLIVVVFFMLIKEACQGLNNLLYWHFMVISIKSRYPLFLIHSACFLALIPAITQIALCFYLAYISIIIVMEAGNAIDLIQNFAGLYILMELDNLVFAFLQLSKLGIFINVIYKNMPKILGLEKLQLEDKLKEVFGSDDITVDFKEHKGLFIFMKIVIVGGLLGFFVYESDEIFEGLNIL